MNYLKIYNQIIEKYKKLNLKKGKGIYLECHHILPRCMNGNNSKENLVNLPAREHFICHLLLPRIYKDTKYKYSLWNAANRFIYGNDMKNKIKITSYQYKIIRDNYSKFCKIQYKGEGNPNYGNKWSEEQKKNLSDQRKGKTLEERIGKEKALLVKKKMSEFQKKREHRKGFKLSLETRLKMSISRKGKKKSEVFKKKCSERMKGNTYGKANKGKKMSKEFCTKISLARKGKPSPNKGRRNWFKQTENTKRRISESLKKLHRKCSEETRRKMSEKARLLRSKKVLCIETGQIYRNYMDASNKTKIKKIGQCCLNRIDQVGGYHWKFID